MNINKNILDILTPLNVFPLSSLKKEVSIYSNPLQDIDNKIDKLLNEIFVQTATDFGLDKKKELLSLITNENNSITEKEQLLAALSIKPNSFNKTGAINSLKALGYDCKIKEDLKNESLTISFKDKNFKPQNISLFKDLVLKMLPAHLDIIFDIKTEKTWADLENMIIDPKKELSWNDLF